MGTGRRPVFRPLTARWALFAAYVATTTYATAGELIERFGGGQEGMRIVSRLFGLCAPMRMEGQDWRLGPGKDPSIGLR